MINPKQLIMILDEQYTRNSLIKLTETYLIPLQNSLPGKSALSGNIKTVSKRVLLKLLADILTDKKKFKLLYAMLPHEVKQGLLLLTWTGEVFPSDILAGMLNYDIYVKPKKQSFPGQLTDPVRPELAILPYEMYYEDQNPYAYPVCLFHLNSEIRVILKEFLEKPEDYIPIPVRELPNGYLHFNSETEILTRFNIMHNFLAQHHEHFSNHRKILQSFYKKFYEFSGLTEFYADGPKEIQNLRAYLMISFLERHEISIKRIENPADFIRDLFQGFFTARQLTRFYSKFFLDGFIKQNAPGFLYQQLEADFRKDFFSLLQLLKPGEWYSITSLLRQVQYRDFNFSLAPGPEPYIHVSAENKFASSYTRLYLDEYNYPLFVYYPLLKGMFFLLAAFGLVEIAYHPPRNMFCQNKNHAYLSVYDGLEYLRLTPLGAYTAEMQPEYEYTLKHEAATLTLDENRLFIYTDLDDELSDMYLRLIADKINNHCYMVSFQSFLRECSRLEDVRNKIQSFYKNISAAPPPLWRKFLEDVTRKIDPFIPLTDYLVFEVKLNQELIQLMTTDEILKNLILKAEKQKILILQEDFRKVKKRFGEFGYLITL